MPSAAPAPAPPAFVKLPVSENDARTFPLPLPAACGPAQVMSLTEAFGRPVGDPATLRFIGVVRSMSASRLSAASDTVYDAGFLQRVAAATARGCTGAVSSVAGARAFVLARQLAGRDLTGSQQTRLLVNLFYAAAALAARRALPPADVATALAPFGTTYGNIEEGAAPVRIAATCKHPNVDAKVEMALTTGAASLPARAQGAGKIRVVLRLDAYGFVRYDRAFDSTLPPESPVLAAAIVSAGASVYDAARAACAPVGGSYLFITDFGS